MAFEIMEINNEEKSKRNLFLGILNCVFLLYLYFGFASETIKIFYPEFVLPEKVISFFSTYKVIMFMMIFFFNINDFIIFMAEHIKVKKMNASFSNERAERNKLWLLFISLCLLISVGYFFTDFVYYICLVKVILSTLKITYSNLMWILFKNNLKDVYGAKGSKQKIFYENQSENFSSNVEKNNFEIVYGKIEEIDRTFEKLFKLEGILEKIKENNPEAKYFIIQFKSWEKKMPINLILSDGNDNYVIKYSLNSQQRLENPLRQEIVLKKIKSFEN
jgi:hypothetical protein